MAAETMNDAVYLDIVRRIVEALTPLNPMLTEDVANAIDTLALTIMETLPHDPRRNQKSQRYRPGADH